MKKVISLLFIAVFSTALIGCYNHSTPAPGKVITPTGKFYVGAFAGKIGE